MFRARVRITVSAATHNLDNRECALLNACFYLSGWAKAAAPESLIGRESQNSTEKQRPLLSRPQIILDPASARVFAAHHGRENTRQVSLGPPRDIAMMTAAAGLHTPIPPQGTLPFLAFPLHEHGGRDPSIVTIASGRLRSGQQHSGWKESYAH